MILIYFLLVYVVDKIFALFLINFLSLSERNLLHDFFCCFNIKNTFSMSWVPILFYPMKDLWKTKLKSCRYLAREKLCRIKRQRIFMMKRITLRASWIEDRVNTKLQSLHMEHWKMLTSNICTLVAQLQSWLFVLFLLTSLMSQLATTRYLNKAFEHQCHIKNVTQSNYMHSGRGKLNPTIHDIKMERFTFTFSINYTSSSVEKWHGFTQKRKCQRRRVRGCAI